jgi:hypothetical protein
MAADNTSILPSETLSSIPPFKTHLPSLQNSETIIQPPSINLEIPDHMAPLIQPESCGSLTTHAELPPLTEHGIMIGDFHMWDTWSATERMMGIRQWFLYVEN